MMAKDKVEEGSTTVLTPPATAALAVVEPGAADLSTESTEESKRRWQERVDYFKKQDKAAWESVLRVHWEKGQFLAELARVPKQYGNRTVENFAQELEVSKETAYAYLRFFQRYTAEEVEKAAEQKMPWRNIVYLLSVEDKNKRDKLQLAVAKGKISGDQLVAEVKALTQGSRKTAKTKGRKVENRGGSTVGTVLRTVTSLCVDLSSKAVEFKDAVRQFRKLEDGNVKSQLAIKLKEAKKALEQTQAKVQDALAMFEEKK